jgi:transcriptional regulator with XRE-family HTH domain
MYGILVPIPNIRRFGVESEREVLSAGEVIARRIREVRDHRGWTQADLAAALKAAGHTHLSRPTLAKIEVGGTRARNLSVEDLLAVAVALNVSPVHLVCPTNDEVQLRVTPRDVVWAGRARAWIRGYWPLREQDDRQDFFREIPRAEFDELLEVSARRQPDPVTGAVAYPAGEYYIRDTTHPEDEPKLRRRRK